MPRAKVQIISRGLWSPRSSPHNQSSRPFDVAHIEFYLAAGEMTLPTETPLSSTLTPPQPARTWQGRATLTFCRRGDRTVPQIQTQAPLKVQRPFYPEGPNICQSVLLHTAGGMVGGDCLSYDLCLAPQTHAVITTAAAAKIYSDHPQPAQVSGKIRIDTAACLEWVPQEVIVFEGAQYHQTWQVELAEQAYWLGWDIVRLGRTARGEKFCRGAVRSRFEVWQNGQLVWVDPQQLIGSAALWQSPSALNQTPVLATLVWIGKQPTRELVQTLRNTWDTLVNPSGEMGITRLQTGLLCRYRGHSTTAARRWFTRVWQHLRPLYASPLLAPPRVWPL
ncbi:MAG: urease accessory protein UreD [Leptolyngbyaceae cyanobacterium]